MKTVVQLAWLVCGTTVLTAALLIARPFQAASTLLDKAFGAPPAWTQVSNLVRDNRIQELSRGEHPLESFRALADHWRGKSGRRVCFIGNSQMLAISLAPGEEPPTAPEPTYVDRLALGTVGTDLLVYRLSAPGMSYSEALWYVHYLLAEPEIRPGQIVIQMNYQAFWNAGIRGGMLEMLENGKFRQAIEKEAASGEPYAETFSEALASWRENRSKAIESRKEKKDPPFAETLEASVRSGLGNAFPPFGERRAHKDDFLEMLYRLRVYVLQLKPSTARTIAGTRWERSKAAVSAIGRLCKEEKIGLLLFHAPLNPQVQLYRTGNDRTRYREFVAAVAADSGAQLVDLESALGDRFWGRWMNFPDPLHIGREGHRALAERFAGLIDAGGKDTAAR